MDFMSAKTSADHQKTSQKKMVPYFEEGNLKNTEPMDEQLFCPLKKKKEIDTQFIVQKKSDGKKVKPFLKWAGGKSQLLTEISIYYPFEDGRTNKYAEPFVGGGAVLFDILNRYDLKEIYISDKNAALINTYQAIRDDVSGLLVLLRKMQEEFVPQESQRRKEYYLEKRERFRALSDSRSDKDKTEWAALMIFLNKTCFNGLYRVNKRGQFNVPMGDYKNPLICDEENLYAVSERLQKVRIVCDDYRASADFIDENTFAYFDPPYRPLTETSSFTSYTETLFQDEQQIALAQFVDALNAKGAKILVSNSDPQNINQEDSFFDDLYASYYIRRVHAPRMINSNSKARGKVKELLISNFKN